MKPSTLLSGIAVLSLLFCEAKASVTFDFDSGPAYTALPLYQSADGITAHFTATGQGFSIQPLPVVGLWPAGFSGNCLSPNSVFASDLLISFDTLLSDISLLYSPEEYGTDTSCTMRITTYNGATSVGTATYTIPGDVFTWPAGTLAISPSQPFDNVVVHYAAAPVTGGDYGPIFMADNVTVTAAVPEPDSLALTAIAGLLFLFLRRRARNYLRGFAGDSINHLLAATAWNLRKWMRMLLAFLRRLPTARFYPPTTLAPAMDSF
jgi:hypothetical protein